MKDLENELSQARTDFLNVCVNLNYNKSFYERAYNKYKKASDNLYIPKLKEIERRLKAR